MKLTDNQRIEELKKLLKLSANALSKGLNLSSPQIFYDIKAGKCGISKDLASKIQEKYFINYAWLLTGEGEIFEESKKKTSVINKEYKGVPYYDMDVTASIVESFDDTGSEVAYYMNMPQFKDCTAAFPVYGDSMIPEYHSGDIVFVKQITNIASMLWGETYLVITNANCDNMRTIKNVFISDDRQNFILRAINPRYAGDTIVPCEDVVAIFVVKGSVNRKQL